MLTQSTTVQMGVFLSRHPAITPAEADALIDRVQQGSSQPGVSALTLWGSSPSPATNGVLQRLDFAGPHPADPQFSRYLRPYAWSVYSWGFWPSVLQLNRKEAAGQVGKLAVNDQDGTLFLLANWHRHGVICGAMLTLGPNSALVQVREKRYRAFSPATDALNPIGLGDRCSPAWSTPGWRGPTPSL